MLPCNTNGDRAEMGDRGYSTELEGHRQRGREENGACDLNLLPQTWGLRGHGFGAKKKRLKI
jgi:hypothetical protein